MSLPRELAFKLPMVRGDDVREVQQALIRAGIPLNSADGLFGPSTRDAVIEFQKKLRSLNPAIEVDGIVGRDTWSALFTDRAAVLVTGLTVGPPVSRMDPTARAVEEWRQELQPYADRLATDHDSPLGTGTLRWSLTKEGVVIAGEAGPRRTKGAPTTVSRAWENFRVPIEKCAAAYGVPLELIIATACTESGGKPDRERIESGYISDEATPHRISLGLMQTLISTARETLNDSNCGRAQLLQPEISIRAGTAYIRQQATRGRQPTNFDPPLVGIAYNAGSLRRSASNAWGLVQTDRGGGHVHADAFVEYFNDIFAVFEAAPAAEQPGSKTPSFWALLN